MVHVVHLCALLLNSRAVCGAAVIVWHIARRLACCGGMPDPVLAAGGPPLLFRLVRGQLVRSSCVCVSFFSLARLWLQRGWLRIKRVGLCGLPPRRTIGRHSVCCVGWMAVL